MAVAIQPFGAVVIDMLKALGVPHTQITRVTVDITAREMPLLTVTRVVDVEDVQALKDRKSTRLNSSHSDRSRMPSSA